MQARCPLCSTPFQLDDSKVPDRAFKVRCPRCQHVITLEGRTAQTAPPSQAPPPTAPAPPRPAPAPAPAPVRREHTGSKGAGDALVALPDTALASAVTGCLAGLDYNVDVVEDVEEGARLLEQGVYELAVTTRRKGAHGHETLGERIQRLTPDTRRRVFVVLVGEEHTTADGTQAWAVRADLVLHPHDLAHCENALRATMAEKKRLYQPFDDARQRIESD